MSNSSPSLLAPGARRPRPAVRFSWVWIGVAPFFLFATLFLFLPSFVLFVGSFQDAKGNFTFANIAGLFTPSILSAYWITIRISAVTAVMGGLFGFLIIYSALLGGLPRWVRTALSTFSGVASNFAGVPLAFAFIATLGRLGLVTVLLRDVFHINIYDGGFSLYSFWGLSLTYLYFQFPLMVLIITPALEGLEARLARGGGEPGRIPVAVLALRRAADLAAFSAGDDDPAFRQCLRRVRHGAFTHRWDDQPGDDPDRLADQGRRAAQRRAGICVGVGHGGGDGGLDGRLLRPAPPERTLDAVIMKIRNLWSWLWVVLGTLYFFVPLLATFEFSLRAKKGVLSFLAYQRVLQDPQFIKTFLFSLEMGVLTIIASLILVAPTAYWIRMRLPQLRPVVEFITLMPFVVPAIVLVFGLIRVYSGGFLPLTNFKAGTNILLVGGYMVLALPYMYRAVDNGLAAIDVRTLTEAAQSLGAGLGDDPAADYPPQPARGAAQRGLPDPGDGDRRVHDRQLPGGHERVRPLHVAGGAE